MKTDVFEFSNIAGKPAIIEINHKDNHMVINWGNLEICDISGYVGFWTSFNKKPSSYATGAARNSAIRAHAKSIIEDEIYSQMEFLQNEKT